MTNRPSSTTDPDAEGAQDAGSFGGVLLKARHDASLSQGELSARSGVSVPAIRRLEREPGHRAFPSTIRALADALGLDGPSRERFLALGNLRQATNGSGTPAASAPEPPPAASPIPALLRSAVPIVGRDEDLARLLPLLADPARHPVVTLVGPGGVGKTRLAIEVLARAAEDRPVVLVPLERLAEPADVLPAVARALGVPEAGRETVADAVAAAIGDRPLLLALDNFEHLLGAAPDVAALTECCPALTLLATSREALLLAGEWVVSLAPLPPGPAAELFRLRARRADPDFDEGEAAREAVAALCARVDGLPLAIEIAAAQMDVMTPATLLALLAEAGLGALQAGRRDGPRRFASMEAAIAWGHDRLDPAAQACLRALGVFAGGGDLETVAEVAAALAGGPADPPAAARACAALARTHLARLLPAEPGDPRPRVVLLEPVRLFALDRLRALGEEQPARRAHAAAVGRRARPIRERRLGPETVVVLHRLERDHDNVRAAFDWALASRDGAVLRDLVPGAGMLWYLHGHLAEGQRRLDALLALGDAVSAETLGYASGSAGLIAADLGQAATVLRHADRLEQAAAAVGSPLGTAFALLLRSQVLGADPATRAEAAALAERALALVPAIVATAGPESAPVYEAWALGRLGVERRRAGDLAAARASLEASLAIRREIRNPWGLTVALGHLGLVLLDLGQPRAAAAHLAEALGLAVADRDVVRGHQVAVLLREAALLGDGPEAMRLAALLDGAAVASAERHARPLPPSRAERLAGLADLAATVALGRGCALDDLPGLVADLPGILPERTERRPEPLPEAFTVLE